MLHPQSDALPTELSKGSDFCGVIEKYEIVEGSLSLIEASGSAVDDWVALNEATGRMYGYLRR